MADERRRQPEQHRDEDARRRRAGGSDLERPAPARSATAAPTAASRAASRGTGRPPATRSAGRSDRPGRPPTALAASTRTIYRFLLLRGLSEAEAANLTAFLCGLPIGERPWQLREVNQLLFLRELHRQGRFERGGAPTGLDEARPPLA